MTNTETDNHRELILETWCYNIICSDCKKVIAYSNKFMPSQYEYLCDKCLERTLE